MRMVILHPSRTCRVWNSKQGSFVWHEAIQLGNRMSHSKMILRSSKWWFCHVCHQTGVGGGWWYLGLIFLGLGQKIPSLGEERKPVQNGWLERDPSVFVAFHSSQFLPTSKRMPRWENKQSKHSPHQKHYYCKRPWKCLPSSIFHVVKRNLIVYIYAEPNWPLFCLERTLFWRFDLPKIEVILVLGVVYISLYY